MRRGWRSGRGSRSFWWCCRSTWSAMAYATRWIRGRGNARSLHCERSEAIQSFFARERTGLLGRFAPRNDESLNHHFPHHPAAVHFVFEIDHRRPGEMPGQTAPCGAAFDQRFGEDGMEVVHGIGLRRRGVLPADTEFGHALLHHADDVTDFFRQTVRAEVAV